MSLNIQEGFPFDNTSLGGSQFCCFNSDFLPKKSNSTNSISLKSVAELSLAFQTLLDLLHFLTKAATVGLEVNDLDHSFASLAFKNNVKR